MGGQQLFNNHGGKRGQTMIEGITYAALYDIMKRRVENISGNFDPDAVCQNICVELEIAMKIFPNVER